MKKSILLILFLLFVIEDLKAQYIVIKVIGKITSGGTPITPGKELKSTKNIKFSSSTDKLFLIEIGKGEEILAPDMKAAKSENRLAELAGLTLHLSSSSGSLSGRGLLTEPIPAALQPSPASNGKVIIERENKFLFDPNQFPQVGGATFFVQVDVPGQKPLLRRLKTNNDTLLINYTDLVAGKADTAAEYKIGYKNEDNKTLLVTSFNPYFDLTNETQDMIINSIAAYRQENITKDAARDRVYNIVYVSSGKPNGIRFTGLFNKYWQSKSVIR